jgi:hypothetical protein
MLCLSDSIRHDDPCVQQLLSTIEEAHTLAQLILAVWPLARVLARHVVEYVLAERAQRPRAWPPCPTCGVPLRSKGFAQRQLMSLFGPIRWRRRVGRCPHRCAIPQVAPFDEALGVQPHQRTSGDLLPMAKARGIPPLGRTPNALPAPQAPAYLPMAKARGITQDLVSPRAVWCWVQAAGHHAMALLQEELDAVAQGHTPTPEPLAADLATLPLALGADGVMVPFRPGGGVPTGKTRWRDIKGSCTSRLRLIRQPENRVQYPLLHHLCEGVLPWYRISFSTSWCWSPWCGCASCSSGRGPATLPLLAQRHRSLHPHCPSAIVSRNPLRASPPSRIAMPVYR